MSGQTSAFEQQLPSILDMWTNNLRNGNSNIRAFKDIAQRTGQPAAAHITRVVDDVAAGIPLNTALQNMLQRVPSEKLELVVKTLESHRQNGGNLPDMLDKVRLSLETAQ